jgi:hypothetical protein
VSLPDLLNVPNSESDWEIFAFANRDINTQIRQRIQDTTGNILAIVMTSNGSGYTSAPTVAITDANGTGVGATAIATYTVSGGFYNITVAVLTQGAGYVRPVITFSGGGGTGATAVAEVKPVVNLTEYQLYPINFNRFHDFLENNSQAHDDFNSVLGLQSSDIEELDPKDRNKLQAWIYLNFKELQSACLELKI